MPGAGGYALPVGGLIVPLASASQRAESVCQRLSAAAARARRRGRTLLVSQIRAAPGSVAFTLETVDVGSDSCVAPPSPLPQPGAVATAAPVRTDNPRLEV